MYQRKPCLWCGRRKPSGRGVKVCGQCHPVDAVWGRLELGPGDCWLCTGCRDRQGYGRFSASDSGLVHRMVYEFLIAEIPDGLDLDHLCLVHPCANPWHLEPVTRGENSRRKWANYTHCKNGHEFTPANTYVDPKGIRSCRTCTNASVRRYNARRKAAGWTDGRKRNRPKRPHR